MTALLKLTLSASVLIAAVALLRAVLLERLPKSAFTLLWLVAALRLVVPFSVPVPVSIPTVELPQRTAAVQDVVTTPVPTSAATPLPRANAAPQGSLPVQNTVPPIQPVPQTAMPTPIPAPVPHITIDWARLTAVVWALGCVAALAWFVLGHYLSLRRYREALPACDPAIDNIVRRFGIRRTVHVKICQSVSTPLTYGVLRPVILLPKSLEHGSRLQLAYILTHELTHIRRFHILYKYVLTAAVCLHWFNPLAWVMYALAGQDLELSCDEAVLRYMGSDRERYALTLIGLEERRGLSPLLSGFGAKAVKERITLIMKYRKKSILSLVLAVVLVLGSMTVFASAAEPGQSNPPKPDVTPVPALATPAPMDAEVVVKTTVVTPQPTPLPIGGIGDRTELVLGLDNTTSMDMISLLIRQFNEANPNYYVTVEYYVDGLPGWKSFDDLNAELANGTAPDLLMLRNMLGSEGSSYLEDLSPWLARDRAVQEWLIPSLYNALAERDQLRYMPVTIVLEAYMADQSAVDGNANFTMAQAREYADAAGVPVFDQYTSSHSQLWHLARIAEQYVDRQAGTCDFTSQGFTDILDELTNYSWAEPEVPDGYRFTLSKALVGSYPLYSYQDIRNVIDYYELLAVGFPSEGGSGCFFEPYKTVSMVADSDCKDGAWAFIRFMLSDDAQQIMQMFSTEGIPATQWALDTLTPSYLLDKVQDLIAGTCSYYDQYSLSFPAQVVEYWGAAALSGDHTVQEAVECIQADVTQYLETGIMTAYPASAAHNLGDVPPEEDYFIPAQTTPVPEVTPVPPRGNGPDPTPAPAAADDAH